MIGRRRVVYVVIHMAVVGGQSLRVVEAVYSRRVGIVGLLVHHWVLILHIIDEVMLSCDSI